jgi:hypothetical protein
VVVRLQNERFFVGRIHRIEVLSDRFLTKKFAASGFVRYTCGSNQVSTRFERHRIFAADFLLRLIYKEEARDRAR